MKVKIVVFLSLAFSLTINCQHFTKFFSFGAGNPFSNTSFINCHELKDSSGYLILADRYATTRSALLIKTDSTVNEVWCVALNFQSSPAPYDNINFIDLGELSNGNYFVFGQTGANWHPYYVFFVFDTAGNVLYHRSIYDVQNPSSTGNYAQVHAATDGSVIIAFSEYDRFGYYRLDTALNVVASGFYTHPSNANQNWGRDCIMLHDSSMLITHGTCLTETDINGNVQWSKEYSFSQHIKCAYESPTGMLYTGGWGGTGPTAASLAKFDGNGNPVFARYYNMAPFANTSAVWNIIPCDDHLMLYSDSVLIVTDTNGNVIGWGKTIDATNYKFLRPTNNEDVLLTGHIFQDSTGNYEYTLMRFDDSTQMGCLHPRGIITTIATITAQNIIPNTQASNIVSDTFAFNSTFVNVNYDPLNGCPESPAYVADIIDTHDGMTVYPNPADDHVVIQFNSSGEHFEVYDVAGRSVFSAHATPELTFELNTTDWANGLYTVISYNENAYRTQKLVINH